LKQISSGSELQRYDYLYGQVTQSNGSVDKSKAISRSVAATGINSSSTKEWEQPFSYDETQLKVGDSLREKIDEGLAKSRFEVVVLSLAFFSDGPRESSLDSLPAAVRERSDLTCVAPRKLSRAAD
jgi:hypothetical protein